MIVDAESYGLVNAIESLLQDAEDGEIKPELMESVLEISTNPAPNTAEAGEQLRAPARPGARDGRRARPDHRLGRHPPVRDVGGPADRRAPALPRAGHRAALRRAPGADLRHARPRRRRRPRQGDPRRQRHARPPRRAAGAERQLAVLARRRDRACSRPARRSSAPSRASASRPHYRDWADYESEIAFMVESGRDGGLHLALVRRAPAPEVRDGRGPRVRLADPRRAHARPRRARAGDGQGAVPSTTRPAASSPPTRGRCSTRTSGWPPATGSTASSSTCPRASASPPRRWRGGCCDRLREHAQDLGSAARARGDRRPARRAATAPSASWSSTRPTTTCARSWPRSSRRRRRRT